MPKHADDDQIEEVMDQPEEEATDESAEQVEQPSDDQETEELKRQLARALADYQNLQRRVNDERVEIAKYATKNLVQELLPVLDHLDQAVSTAPEEEQKSNWFLAVKMSVGQFKEILKHEGIEEINPEHKEFDSTEHEVVDVTTEGKHNHITRVLQKGYKLHGRVIQPARVVVAKKEKGD